MQMSTPTVHLYSCLSLLWLLAYIGMLVYFLLEPCELTSERRLRALLCGLVEIRPLLGVIHKTDVF